MKGFHSVSSIKSTVFCEKKMLLDREHHRESPKTAALKKDGIKSHEKFDAYHKQQQGLDQSKRDSRCYIATHVFGFDAPETNSLRQWRDDVLLKSRAGRLFVRAYYLISPVVIRYIGRSATVNAAAKNALLRLIQRIEQARTKS